MKLVAKLTKSDRAFNTFEGCIASLLASIPKQDTHLKLSKRMADILETAANEGSFKTLLSALEAAGLLDILKSPGPFTVFAPTDEAFAKVPEDTMASWMENIPKLKQILTYHVLFGDVRTDNFVEIDSAETVEGGIMSIDSIDDGFKVNDAKVLKTDILTDNGVIHVIDSVLVPTILSK
jgi:uncharacterized surface protein with fasciclin (FAS1) repeats